MCILLEQQLVLILYSSSTPTLVLRAVVVVRLTRTCITLEYVWIHNQQVCILYSVHAYVYSRVHLPQTMRTPRMHTLCILLYTEQYQSMHMHTYCSLWIHVNVYTCTPRTRVVCILRSRVYYIYIIYELVLYVKNSYNTYAYIASMLVLYGYQLELVLVYDSQYAYESYYAFQSTPSTSS